MSQRRLLHIILGIAFCTVFALGISQNQTVDSYKNFLTSYEKADRLYREAVVVSEQENYTEAKETQLNQQALQSFQELAKKLPSHESKFDSLSFFVYFKMGELQHYFENLSQALLHYRESITIKKEHLICPIHFSFVLIYLVVLFTLRKTTLIQRCGIYN